MTGFESPELHGRSWAGAGNGDSVEFKAQLVIPPGTAGQLLTGRSSLQWSERRLYLLDTSALDLLRGGVEIRLRGRARGRQDLTVSVRRSGPGAGPEAPPGARIEIDVAPGASWQDTEVRCGVDPRTAAHVIGGGLAPGQLLSSTQREWARRGGHGIVDDDQLADLRVHGPLVVHRVRVRHASAAPIRVDLEHARFPGGRELTELSLRCRPGGAAQGAAMFQRLLDEHDIPVHPESRTKSALWFDDVRVRRRIRRPGPMLPTSPVCDPTIRDA